MRSTPVGTQRCATAPANRSRGRVCTAPRTTVALTIQPSQSHNLRVSERGLEPPCPLRALAPQASASTYSATRTSALVSPPARMTIATSSRGCDSPHHPPGRLLEPLDVRPPPVGIMVGEIAALRTRTDPAVDQLADDVGMAC